MKVIPWTVELLPGTPRRGFHAHLHNFGHIHTATSKSSPTQAQVHNTANRRRTYATSHPWAAVRRPAKGNGYAKDLRRHVHDFTSPGGNFSSHADYYRTEVDSLLAALRQGNSLKLYFCLLDLTRGASVDNHAFCRAVQSIPPTTFSEILRNFDPFHVSEHVDSAPGIAISWGAAIHSPLGDLINKWGVKLLYVRILNRLRLLQLARQMPHVDGSASQIRPLLRDYLVLLRCAGATSDIQVAKAIWEELVADGYREWEHAELFSEYIKARYLTEALYANNDLARFRLRPLDLHRSAAILSRNAVRKLKNLQAAMINRYPHRFGQNVNDYYYAEPLTRQLRRRIPLARLERRMIIRGMLPGDELLLCALLKANGRLGRLAASNVLMRFWGIQISTSKPELGKREISGGYDFPPGSAQAPTEALLDAVVHCYGNMGEVLLAKALVDFISRRWSIAVPDKAWSDLLDFARIHSTIPATSEWRIAQVPPRLITPAMVLDIWDFCTQEPHNFQPDMRDYYSLIKSILHPRRPLHQFLDAIRQLMPLYNKTARETQVAWTELNLTTQQGVPNHAAYRRYRVLQSRKHYMWYCFHYAARQALNKLNPLCVDSAAAVRETPDLVAETGPFLDRVIRYRIATGTVELSIDYGPLRIVELEQTLQQPEPLSRTLKRWSTGRTVGIEPVNLDWAALEKTLSEATSFAALQDYMKMMGHKLGAETQQEKDEHMIDDEDGEEEDAGQESIYDRHEEEAPPDQDERLKETIAEPDEVGDRGGMDRHIVVKTLKSERHARDVFDESRNSKYDSSTGESPPTAWKKESVMPGDPFSDAFAFHYRDSVDNPLTSEDSEDWDKDDTANTVGFAKRRSMVQQLVDRPAHGRRLRYSAPPGEPSLLKLREDGKEFMGLSEDPQMAHFAAHRIIRKAVHVPGVPVRLGLPGRSADKEHLVDHLLWMRTR